MSDDHETLEVASGGRAHTGPDIDDRYVDLGPLGAGAFGEVRRVRDRRLNRIVAMKVLRREHASDPLDVARFIDEAQAAAQLQHPGIVPIYDTGLLPDGRPWFTMREFTGRNLHVAIRDTYRQLDPRSPLPDLHVLIDALRRAADAIGYAHRRGVIHRDLKPGNVLLDEDGAVLVVDWGLAKVVQPGQVELTSRDALLRTMTGTLLGTPAYMPPEQAEGRIRELDARTDVYALGAMLYSILAGKTPYQGKSGLAAVVAVLEGPPTPVRECARFPLPAVLVAICERAMQRDRDDRHPNASAFAEDLASWLQGRTRRGFSASTEG